MASTKKGRRRSRRSSPEGSGQSRGKTGKKKRHRKASNHRGGEYPQTEVAEDAPGEIPTRPVGRINRKVRASTSRAESTKRPDAPAGQRETEIEGALLGGHQQTIVQAPEGPESVHGVVYVEGGEPNEGSNNERTHPSRRPPVYKPRRKAAKRPLPQADPVTTSEEEIGRKGPRGSGKKKAAPSKPPSQPKKKLCHTCGKVCPRLMARKNS